MLDPSKVPALSQSECCTQGRTVPAVYRSRTGAPLGRHIAFKSCDVPTWKVLDFTDVKFNNFLEFPEK